MKFLVTLTEKDWKGVRKTLLIEADQISNSTMGDLELYRKNETVALFARGEWVAVVKR